MSKHPFHERKLRAAQDALADERAAMRSIVAVNERLGRECEQLAEDLRAERLCVKQLVEDLQAERMRVEGLRDQLDWLHEHYKAELRYALAFIAREDGVEGPTVGEIVEHLRGVLGIVGDTGTKIEVL